MAPSTRWHRGLAAAAAALALLTGCGGDDGAGETSAPNPPASPPPAGDWKASPGQLDRVTETVRAKGFACSDLDANGFGLRVCGMSRRGAEPDQYGAIHWSSESVKLVAAPDGTVVQVVFPDKNDDVVETVSPVVFGEEDAAVLAAEGTELSWGTARYTETRAYEGALIATIDGLPEPVAPPAPKLGLTKEQVLLALRDDPSWDCELDDGTSTPEASQLADLDTRPNLDCDTEPYDEEQLTSLEFAADTGARVDDLEFSATRPGAPEAAGVALADRLRTVWPKLGDFGPVPVLADKQLRSPGITTTYADGWKILVRTSPAYTGGGRYSAGDQKHVGYTASVRIQPEHEQLQDPKNR